MLSFFRFGDRKIEKTIAIITIFSFCFIFSFRFDVAPDYTNYYSIYNSLIDGSGRYYEHVINKTEPVFILLNYIFIFLGLPYQSLVVFITAYVCFISILLLNRCNGFYIVCWLVMFPLLMSSLNIMRQAITIFTILLASRFILEGKNKRFILIVLFCSLIHYTSLVCLSFLLFHKIKRFGVTLVVFFLLSILLYFLFKAFGGVAFVFKIVPVPEVYQAYLNYPYEENAGFGIRVWFELSYVLFFIFILYKRSFSIEVVFYNFMFSLGILLNFAFLEVPILSRIANYFYFFSILAIPLLISELKYDYFKFAVVFLISTYFMMVSYRVISSENYRPYQLILFFDEHTPQPK